MNLKYGPQILEDTTGYIEERERIGKYPSVAGLALFLAVNKRTISRWIKKYEDFNALVDEILLIQEQRLCELGLTGEWNSNIVKLLLCNHGYGKNQDDDEDRNQKAQVNLFFNGIDKDSFTVTSENSDPER